MRSPAPVATQSRQSLSHRPRAREFIDPDRIRAHWRVDRWAVFGAALVYCVLAITGMVPYGGSAPGENVMADGAAYYYVDTPYDWSDRPPGVGEYLYSPAFLAVTAPLRLLPWELFVAVWFAAHIGVLLWLRLPWMLAFPGVVDDVVRGNINTFLALAVVLALSRAAWLWSAVLLTKVTPGVGAVWHAAKGEWRQMGIALGFTAAVCAIGVVVNSDLWAEWAASLMVGVDYYRTVNFGAPLIVRVGVGLVICLAAARSDKAWLVPIGMLVALPGLWPASFALLLASVYLYREAKSHTLIPVLMQLDERVAVPVDPAAAPPERAPVEARDSVNSSTSIKK